ncbi:MAG: hypothetical protein RIB58_12095 [Phycisphaerales bacterium]
MGIAEAEKLQQGIDEVVADNPALRILLDADADVLDLSNNVALRVFEGKGGTYRVFTIVTASWLFHALDQGGPSSALDDSDIYCTCDPLIVVREITADVIVRAVRRYLLISSGGSS